MFYTLIEHRFQKVYGVKARFYSKSEEIPEKQGRFADEACGIVQFIDKLHRSN
jgi:hypothetical protein